MALVHRLGYVTLGVRDLESAVAFYEDLGHLKVSERRRGAAFLTGDANHHWIRLVESDRQGVLRIGYEAESEAALDQAIERLTARGVQVHDGGNLKEDRVDRTIRFVDPDGIEVELFADMVSLPVGPTHAVVQSTQLLHAVWLTEDPVVTAEFYDNVLGFKPSDWIERMAVFMRAGNNYHHTMAAIKGKRGKLDHFCVLVDSIDDVVRARNIAQQHGVALRQDVIRHAASGSVSTYLADPNADICIEFAFEHTKIEDPDHRARILLASAVTADIWQPANRLWPQREKSAELVDNITELTGVANAIA